MDVAPIPGSPKTFAPQAALGPDYVDGRADNGIAERPAHELFERVTKPLPERVRDVMFGAISKINDHVFTSAPPGKPIPRAGDSWSFSVLGDYGNGYQAQADVAANIDREKPDLILTTGDNVYYRGTEKEWQKKWDPPHLMGNLRAKYPVYPSLGNHDMGVEPDAYFKRFPELKGARYYSFEKDDVHFVALNTNESLAPGSPQHEWLAKDLAATDPDDFKVLFFHHPAYSIDFRDRNKNIRGHLAPLVAKNGVNLLLAGHEHWYDRSKPLNEAGTVHVTTGTGGNSLYPFFYPQKMTPWSATRNVRYGHLNFEVRPDAVVGRYILRDGSVADTFELKRPAAGAADAAAGAAHTQSQQPAPQSPPPAAPAPATPA